MKQKRSRWTLLSCTKKKTRTKDEQRSKHILNVNNFFSSLFWIYALVLVLKMFCCQFFFQAISQNVISQSTLECAMASYVCIFLFFLLFMIYIIRSYCPIYVFFLFKDYSETDGRFVFIYLFVVEDIIC